MLILVFLNKKYRVVKLHNLHHYNDKCIIFMVDPRNNIFDPLSADIEKYAVRYGPFSYTLQDNPNTFLPKKYPEMSDEMIELYEVKHHNLYYIG